MFQFLAIGFEACAIILLFMLVGEASFQVWQRQPGAIGNVAYLGCMLTVFLAILRFTLGQ